MRNHVLIACTGIVIYFVIVYFSVNITITGLQNQYSIGDTIYFTANVSGIGSTVYAYSVGFEKLDGTGNIMGLHSTGPGISYLDPPFYFSETLTYDRTIDPDVDPGKYVMKFRVLGHTVEKDVVVLP